MNPWTDPVPAGLPAHEYERLVKLLELHYALPLAYPLAGAIFEELFANAVGGQCEKKKLLFDVLRGATGWSLKTVQVARANVRPGATFEAVIQRCNILTDAAVSARSPAPVLGERILSHFNYFCERSSAAQNIIDPRVAFLVRDKAQRNFLFFQQRFRPYATDEVTWRWANDAQKSVMGYVGASLVLRWYVSGTQLFSVYSVPVAAQAFNIEWQRANLDQTVAFFETLGAVRSNKQP